jgi:hypothetical protein
MYSLRGATEERPTAKRGKERLRKRKCSKKTSYMNVDNQIRSQ